MWCDAPEAASASVCPQARAFEHHKWLWQRGPDTGHWSGLKNYHLSDGRHTVADLMYLVADSRIIGMHSNFRMNVDE